MFSMISCTEKVTTKAATLNINFEITRLFFRNYKNELRCFKFLFEIRYIQKGNMYILVSAVPLLTFIITKGVNVIVFESVNVHVFLRVHNGYVAIAAAA